MVVLALLDLDETLVDRSAAFASWADGFAGELGLDQDERAWLSAVDRQHRQRGHFFTAVHERFPRTADVRVLWDEYAAVIPTLVRPFDGVVDRLERMRAAGWRCIVVTNGRADTQEAKLRTTGLAPLVDGSVVSDAIGLRKPDPEIFRRALDLLAAPDPARVVMVGDDPRADIEPAAALGLRTAWVSHGREWPLAQPPSLTAETTAQVLDLLLSSN